MRSVEAPLHAGAIQNLIPNIKHLARERQIGQHSLDRKYVHD